MGIYHVYCENRVSNRLFIILDVFNKQPYCENGCTQDFLI